jgi:hypothetical protein
MSIGLWHSARSPEEAKRIPGTLDHSATKVSVHFARRNLTMAVVGHSHRFPGIRFASSGLRLLRPQSHGCEDRFQLVGRMRRSRYPPYAHAAEGACAFPPYLRWRHTWPNATSRMNTSLQHGMPETPLWY